MRLTSITIIDLAGFSGSYTFKLAAVSLVQGRHSAGKTSILSVLGYAFGRRPLADAGARGIEHDPGIIHGGKERGDAVITFDDDSSFRVLVTETTTSRQVKVAGDKKWNRATPELIDSLVNALSYDPFTLKELSEKQRVEVLLGASTATVSKEEIEEAAGTFTGTPGLPAINLLSDQLYEQRRIANAAADTLKKHAGQLEGALGPGVDQDWRAEASRLKAEKLALDTRESKMIEKARKMLEAHRVEQAQAHTDRRTVIDTDINARIKALEAERVQRIEESMGAHNAAVEQARTEANQIVAAERAQLKPDRERLTGEIATAEERAEQQSRSEATKQDAETARANAAEHIETSKKLTAAIERLGKLKEFVAGRLAIKGVTIASPRSGLPVDICKEEDGALVPFSRWNEASKDAFCLRMAVLLHGKCGVVFVDEIGHFTAERRRQLIASCIAHAKGPEGLQFILGEAVEGELRVVNAEEGYE